MKIEQVIIVEGKTDTNKLKTIYGTANIDTIETNGLALDDKILKLIAELNDIRGVIIFTDPDGPGIKIRDSINSYLNFKCFNAFINKKSIKDSKKIGIAEADEEDIRLALENLIQFKGKEIETLTWKQYLENDFYNIENRIKIAAHFNWNEKINSKKLFQWLNLLRLSVADVRKILGVS